MRARFREIAAAAQFDPKKALLDSVGDISGFKPTLNLVLVATYIGPEKTRGGIIRPDRSIIEDRFQGKVGLVLAKGPIAFQNDGATNFGGLEPSVGDWVVYRPADALELFFRYEDSGEGTPCRLIEDTLIKGILQDPALIY